MISLLALIVYINIVFSSINWFTGFVGLTALQGFSPDLYFTWKHTQVFSFYVRYYTT